MRGAVLSAPGDVRVEERDDPKLIEPTDAVIRLPATCVCGPDLWPYRGFDAAEGPSVMGHEYVGVVEEVGSQVRNIRPGQFVVGSFLASDNTCELCQAGYQSSCVHREGVGEEGAQAELLGVPLADGTLVATPDLPCGRPASQPAGRLGRARHRLVRGRGRRGPARARRSWWSVTARSGCWACWPPASSGPSGSSP